MISSESGEPAEDSGETSTFAKASDSAKATSDNTADRPATSVESLRLAPTRAIDSSTEH